VRLLGCENRRRKSAGPRHGGVHLVDDDAPQTLAREYACQPHQLPCQPHQLRKVGQPLRQSAGQFVGRHVRVEVGQLQPVGQRDKRAGRQRFAVAIIRLSAVADRADAVAFECRSHHHI
jgi:hypothetical protein